MPLNDEVYPVLIDNRFQQKFDGPCPDHWRQAAEKSGFTIFGRAKDRMHVVLRCHNCSNLTLKRINVVLEHNPECPHCIRLRREIAAKWVGAKLLGPDPKGNRHYGNYRLACKHVDRRQHTRIEAASAGGHKLSCDKCLDRRHKSEAKAQGWRLIGPAKRKSLSYRRYGHGCGHQQDVAVQNMKFGDVNCAGCKETWASKPSKIYILRFDLPGLAVVKLGYSSNPAARLRQVQYDCDRTRGIVERQIDLKSGHRAICVEKALHHHIKNHRPDLIVDHSVFEPHLRTKSEIYHADGRDYISSLLDRFENGWDPSRAT